MNYGFFRVASASLKLKVADPDFNKAEIIKAIDKACNEDVRLLVTPELSVTGYTCADLFFTKALQSSANEALTELIEYTIGKNICVILGMPISFYNSLYNCAVVVLNGKILGIVPKTHIEPINGQLKKGVLGMEGIFRSIFTEE